MIAASTEKKITTPLTDEEIVVELTNLIFAGTDTTGNTFSYMFWELARNPQWQKRLREELQSVSWDDVVPKYKAVSQLPVLDAVIQETLRLWPASPASLPRIASAKGGTVDGTVVPGHVRVCPLAEPD
jgi:cytochrome P450